MWHCAEYCALRGTPQSEKMRPATCLLRAVPLRELPQRTRNDRYWAAQ